MVSNRNVVPEMIHGCDRFKPGQDGRFGLAIHGHQGPTLVAPRLHRFQSTKYFYKHQHSELASQASLNGLAGIGQIQIHRHGNPSTSEILPRLSQGPESDLNSPAKVAVVHHGHLENQPALREALIQRGYRFKGETQGELIAHLLDATYQSDPEQAVHRVLGLMEGSFAMGILFLDHPNRVFAAQRGIPLFLMSDTEKTAWSSHLEVLPVQNETMVHTLSGSVMLDIQVHGYNITKHQGR